MQSDHLVAFRITRTNYETIFDATGLSPTLSIGQAELIPTAFGVLAIAILAAAAWADVRCDLTKLDDLAASVSRFRVIYVLCCVALITSALTASVFLQIPVAGFEGSNRASIQRYASEVTVFWSTIFTLTMVVALLPSHFHLYRWLRSHSTQGIAEEDRKRIQELNQKLGFGIEWGSHGKWIVAALAPLATGATSTYLQSLVAQ